MKPNLDGSGMSSSTINDANQCGLGIDIDWFSGGKSFSLLYATVGNLKRLLIIHLFISFLIILNNNKK